MAAVYVTGAWNYRLCGAFDAFFDTLRAMGLSPYDWTSAEHRALSPAEQSQRIMDHIRRSVVLVFVLDPDADHDYGATQKQLGMALILRKPIKILDTREGVGATGVPHPAIGDVHCRGAMAHHQLSVYTKTEDLLRDLQAWGNGP